MHWMAAFSSPPSSVIAVGEAASAIDFGIFPTGADRKKHLPQLICLQTYIVMARSTSEALWRRTVATY